MNYPPEMQHNGYQQIMNSTHFSTQFIGEISRTTAGFLSPEELDKLFSLLENEASIHYFSQSSEVNLLRILNALYDKVSFLQDCIKYPRYASILVSVAFNSNFLTDVIVRNPEYLYWIINTETLKNIPDEKGYRKLVRDSLLKYRTFQARTNTLRLLRSREVLRIGICDILHESTLQYTTSKLSELARVINSELFELCLQEILDKYQIKRFSRQYCIVALGKLGGNELNYSSDVDLILFFEKNTHISSAGREYYEILTEAIQLFIQTSCDMTSRGYIYRVDFRLRPDGRNSPLCRTLKDYLRYYETRGEDWERQMLIKAGFIGGSRKLFDRFTGYLSHYIYPSSFLNSPLSQIASMKNAIETRSGSESNVKLFAGGIRDIEFSVQALQLLNGGRIASLRTGSTLEAIRELKDTRLLSEDEAIMFEDAYIFYRRIEHYMQLMNDTQTHLIPEDEEMLGKLSSFLGFKNAAAFRKKLDSYRKQVRNIFTSIVGTGKAVENKAVTEIVTFREVKRAADNYKYLQTGQGLLEQKNFDKHTMDTFARIEPELLDFLQTAWNPDLVLENFSRIVKSYPFPSIWFSEFSDTKFFRAFLSICQGSQKAVDLMLLERSLGDLLLTRQVLMPDIPDYDIPVVSMIFGLCVRYSLGLIGPAELSDNLSRFIEYKIRQKAEEMSFDFNYFIIGLGSLGSGEMTFNSDADLVIVAEDVNSYPFIQMLFQDFVNEIISLIKPFEIDFRLRPEGRNSQLVWDIKNYFGYLEKRAQIWEFQAMTRMRFICGNSILFGDFLSKVKEHAGQLEKTRLKDDIADMRRKIDKQNAAIPQNNFPNFFNIKKSRGGLIESEFIAQYLMLMNKDLYSSALGSDTGGILSAAADYYSMPELSGTLSGIYTFFRGLTITNQILFNSGQNSLPLDNFRRYLLARAAGFSDQRELEDKLKQNIRKNRQYFEKIILES